MIKKSWSIGLALLLLQGKTKYDKIILLLAL